MLHFLQWSIAHLKRQAKEADRQYQQAIGELNRSTLSREEQQYIQFYCY